MKGKVLMVERLERRKLLAALWGNSVGEPVQTRECVQVQECVAECDGPVQVPVQTQTQTQTQARGQNGTGPGPIQEPAQTQNQTQTREQDGAGPGPIQEPVQTQTQTQQQDGSGDQDGDCDCKCPVNDAAIESYLADDGDPLRQRSGEPAQDDGNYIQKRDGSSW